MFRGWKRIDKTFFDEFEKDFEEMNGIIDSMMRNLGKGSHVYGFSMIVGPDGVPHTEHFGDDNHAITGENRDNAIIEPYTSSISDEKKNELYITAEMPGIGKEDIEINATENEVIIKAQGAGRKYYKSVQTPAIDPDSSKAKYNNGVLEVILKLKEVTKPDGIKINIE
jgi:HSP20 family protein